MEDSNTQQGNPRILIVGNDNGVVEDLTFFLSMHFGDVHLAATGLEGLKAVSDSEAQVVITAGVLPDMDGYEFSRLLHRDISSSRCAVALMTSLSDPGDLARALQTGVDSFIPLPLNEEQVIGRIRALLTSLDNPEEVNEVAPLKALCHDTGLEVTANRRQLTNLLLTMYDNSRQQAQDLITLHGEINRTNKLLKIQNETSEKLLLNVLPRPIADRLKATDGVIADGFDDVTILFADIVDFTSISAGLDPGEVVHVLNDIFSTFDQLAESHGLEKIKTIGDAYMVVGGIPQQRQGHALAIAEMALDMMDAIRGFKTAGGEPIRLRIGINTGPVVAGVIGIRKFIYDLWGDTVNVASRMESLGNEDTIQVTESTYGRLKDRFEFTRRGEIWVKGKGEMTTFFLTGRKTRSETD